MFRSSALKSIGIISKTFFFVFKWGVQISREVTSKDVNSHYDMAMIQPSFTSSKWNKGETFGLKFHLSYHHMHTPHIFFWNPSIWKEGHSCYCICNFVEKTSSLCSSMNENKMASAWSKFQKYFFLDHFPQSFLGQKW